MATSNIRLWGLNETLNIVRLKINDTWKALLSNYADVSPPLTTDYQIEDGSSPGIPSGTLWYDTSNGVLTINDSTKKRAGGYSGGWTRHGIGIRVYNSLVAANANVAYIEEGELFATLAGGANNRVYLKTNGSAGIIDVGSPGANTITNTMIADRAINNTKISTSNPITQYEVATRGLVNTNFAASTITQYEVATRGLANTNFIAGSITQYEIADNTLPGTIIQDSSISLNKFSNVTAGSILYGAVTSGALTALNPGSAGYVLKSTGSVPVWQQPALVGARFYSNSICRSHDTSQGNSFTLATTGASYWPANINCGVETFNVAFTPSGTNSNLLIEWCVYASEYTDFAYNLISALFISNQVGFNYVSGNTGGSNGFAVAVAVNSMYYNNQYTIRPVKGSKMIRAGTGNVYISIRTGFDRYDSSDPTNRKIIMNGFGSKSTFVDGSNNGVVSSWLKITEVAD